MDENKEKQEQKETVSPYDKQHIYSNVKVPFKVLDFVIVGLIIVMGIIIFTAKWKNISYIADIFYLIYFLNIAKSLLGISSATHSTFVTGFLNVILFAHKHIFLKSKEGIP